MPTTTTTTTHKQQKQMGMKEEEEEDSLIPFDAAPIPVYIPTMSQKQKQIKKEQDSSKTWSDSLDYPLQDQCLEPFQTNQSADSLHYIKSENLTKYKQILEKKCFNILSQSK